MRRLQVVTSTGNNWRVSDRAFAGGVSIGADGVYAAVVQIYPRRASISSLEAGSFARVLWHTLCITSLSAIFLLSGEQNERIMDGRRGRHHHTSRGTGVNKGLGSEVLFFPLFFFPDAQDVGLPRTNCYSSDIQGPTGLTTYSRPTSLAEHLHGSGRCPASAK
jgi:hypothetical protein